MNSLIENIDKLHTTELGLERIKKNLQIETNDIIPWCKTVILAQNTFGERIEKNWYVTLDNYRITINAHSYTVITAHRLKSRREYS